MCFLEGDGEGDGPPSRWGAEGASGVPREMSGCSAKLGFAFLAVEEAVRGRGLLASRAMLHHPLIVRKLVFGEFIVLATILMV